MNRLFVPHAASAILAMPGWEEPNPSVGGVQGAGVEA
jgi:hypothetical protein